GPAGQGGTGPPAHAGRADVEAGCGHVRLERRVAARTARREAGQQVGQLRLGDDDVRRHGGGDRLTRRQRPEDEGAVVERDHEAGDVDTGRLTAHGDRVAGD